MKNILPGRLLSLLLSFVFIAASCSKDGNSSAAPDSAANNGAGGSLARYTIVGDYLYLVDDYNLDVYDCRDLANPVKKSSQMIGFGIETIYPFRDKLFIGSTNGMYVYSIEDPAAPKLEGSVTHVRACDPVVANDSAAYVTLKNFGTTCGGAENVLNVYDVKNVQNPELVRTVTMKSPGGLGIYRSALYVCEGLNGLTVFDISKGYEPVAKRTIKGKDYQDVIPYNGLLICHLSDGICFYDLSDPLEPVEYGTVKN